MCFRELGRGLVLAVICCGACGSPPPSAVDEELLFVDIEACANGEPSCERSGSVGPAELLLEGNHGVMLWAKPECGPTAFCEAYTEECCSEPLACVKMGACSTATVPPPPARISLPIRSHTPDARLAWIAIGLTAGQPNRTLHVKIDGQEETIIQPAEGWARVEVSGRNQIIPDGARLELTAERGIFGIAWIVGRWKR